MIMLPISLRVHIPENPQLDQNVSKAAHVLAAAPSHNFNVKLEVPN